MRFMHMADVHLGCVPDGKKEWAKERSSELWETFRSALDDASRMGVSLVLIAGDLFHDTPTVNELREVSYLFSSYPDMCFALIAGNHDCNAPGSAWDDFEFAGNVAFLGNTQCECVRFNALNCEVYGFSYDRKVITEPRYDRIRPSKNDCLHILLAHGGDASHIPISPRAMERSGFDYIALGHIHRPSVMVKDLAIYPGALSPIDAGDEGPHGYMLAETSGHQVSARFIRKAKREYVSMTVLVDEQDTLFAIRDKLEIALDKRGRDNIYKITLSGQRNPSVYIDTKILEKCGMITDITDRTVPAFHLDELRQRYSGQLIGKYIESFEGHERSLTEQKALQYGLEALLSQ